MVKVDNQVNVKENKENMYENGAAQLSHSVEHATT